MQKNQKSRIHPLIFHKTWKTSFWVHFGPILAKSSKFDVLTLANTWKTSFWTHFVPLLTQKPQKKTLFSKKPFWSILSLYIMQKPECFWSLTFHKTSFSIHCGPFCPGNLMTRYFLIKSFKSTLRFLVAIISRKKSNNFTKHFKNHILGPFLTLLVLKSPKKTFFKKSLFVNFYVRRWTKAVVTLIRNITFLYKIRKI